jgi:hypothetical protein
MVAQKEEQADLYELHEDHIEFVKNMNFTSVQEYRWFLKDFRNELPSYMTATPEIIFKEIGFNWNRLFSLDPDFDVHERDFMSLSEARQLMYRLGVKKKAGGLSKLMDYGLLPQDFPKNFAKCYESQGYTTAKDLFDFSAHKKMASYEQMKQIVARFKLASSTQYGLWYEKHSDNFDITIPSNPQSTYTNGGGWVGWDDFLSRADGASGKDAKLNFVKARAYMHKVGLKSYAAWEAWKNSGNKPANIPSSPHRKYADEGWAGVPDFLGYTFDYGNKSRGSVLSYEAAKQLISTLGVELNSRRDYLRWHKQVKPEGLPARPDNSYSKNRKFDWNDFLGLEPIVESTELESEINLMINTISLSAVFVAPDSQLLSKIDDIPQWW